MLRRRAIAYFALNLASPHRRLIVWLLAGVVAVILLNAGFQLWLNVWQGSFYEALSRRDADLFNHELWIFLIIVTFLVAVGTLQTWFTERLKIKLREALIGDLFDHWLRPKQAYRLSLMGEIGVNPDQRLQEDARHLCELQADLMVGFIQASLLLVSFVGVLWVLSDRVVFNWRGTEFTIPGYMVWAALLYAGVGSAFAWWRGHPLIRLNAQHYALEADFRYGLVRVSDGAEGVALYGGEGVERAMLDGLVSRVVTVGRELAYRLAGLFWVTSAYGYLAIVAPILLAAPGYFGSALSFGALMMVVGAFQQVQGALRWFVDNLSRIADYHATFLRVMSFREALIDLEEIDRKPGRIVVAESGGPDLVLDDLVVQLSDGQAGLQEPHVTIRPGERVRVIGDPGSGKAALFRTLAGLTGAGGGRIGLPSGKQHWMFVPQRPYLPLGTLADALSYPSPGGSFESEELRQALRRIGLARLAEGELYGRRRWDRDLSPSEQQCIAFARLLLQHPAWVVLDGALETLDAPSRARVISIFATELKSATLISIGEKATSADLGFTMTLHLVNLNDGDLEAAVPSSARNPETVHPW